MRTTRFWLLAGSLALAACQCDPSRIKTSCQSNSECPAIEACRGGVCTGCSECAGGTVCLRGACYPSACGGQACSTELACIDGACRGVDCIDRRCVDADAAADSGVDAGLDAGMDAGLDASVDAGFDAGMDAGLDAGLDAGADAGMDAGFFTTLLTQQSALRVNDSLNWMVDGRIIATIDGADASVSATVFLTAMGSGTLPIGSYGSHAFLFLPLPDGGSAIAATDQRIRSPVWSPFTDRLLLPLQAGHYRIDANFDLWLEFDTTDVSGRVSNVRLTSRPTALDHTNLIQITRTP